MAEANKILGQLAPAAENTEDLYTVPVGKEAVVSTYTACNQNAFATTFGMSVAVNGEAALVKQYVHVETPLDPFETFEGTLGITLGPGDVVRVYSFHGSVSFNLFGVEITP